MFCTHCGKEIGDDALFCIYCGEKTKNAVQETPIEYKPEKRHRHHVTEEGAVPPAPAWGEGQPEAPQQPAWNEPQAPVWNEPQPEWNAPAEPVQNEPQQPAWNEQQPQWNAPRQPAWNAPAGNPPAQNAPAYGTNPPYPNPPTEPRRRSASGAKRSRRQQSGSGPLLFILLGVAALLLVAGLAFLVIHLLAVGGDVERIEAVETSVLGEYDSSLKEMYNGYFGGHGYDTVTWEGAYTGFLRRGVQLSLTKKGESDLPPVRIRFDVKSPYCRVRAVDAGNGWNNNDAEIARYLNSLYYTQETQGMAADAEAAYLTRMNAVSSSAVLYGAAPQFQGSSAEIAQVFKEATVKTTVLETLGLGKRLESLAKGETVQAQPIPGEIAVPAATAAPGSEPQPQESAVPTDLNNPHVASGEYGAQDGSRRLALSVSSEPDFNDPTHLAYTFILTQGNDDGSRTLFSFEGVWDEDAQAILYRDGGQLWHVKINGEYQDRVLLNGADGRMVPREDGTLVWQPGNPGQNQASGEVLPQAETVFVPGARTWEDAKAEASVSRQTPGNLPGKIHVVTARASSTIQQQTVSNEPILMFDGKDETSWQEGVEGYGVGESIGFSLDGTYGVTAMAFKLGNWRNKNYFDSNAMPKKMTIILGDERFTVEFTHEQTVQWVTFSAPVYVDNVTILIDDVYKGTKYEDTCINEISVYGTRMP